MSNYQIFVDLGLSGTKAGFIDRSICHSYLCPPKVADLTPSELQILRDQGDQYGGGLESGAYLQLGESAYALASDAEGRPNKTTAMLRKSALANLRILGAIGEMAYRFKTTHLAIDVGVALPFDEYLCDQAALIEILSKTKSFVYRGQQITLEIQTMKVLPEGAGLVQWRKMQAAQNNEPADQTYVVVMIGYRDLTFLLFREGKPPTGEPSGSVKFGYLEFLQSIARGMCKPENPFLYDALLRNADTVAFPDQPGKVFSLKERRQKSEDFYWEQIRHHLSDKFAALNFPRYEVLIGGGTALTLLRPHLANYLETLPGATVNWLPALTHEITRVFKDIQLEADQIRFGDCYGGAKWLAVRSAHSAKKAVGRVS
ncbi:ParM/StbA family protein [Leptolyngbya sp. NIES-2104]|uniref:ParM/StbA family protein n=1 Tax=Leptolyngbya sp. NIES-2104 TaxID=1552121 RepID=UPI0006ECC52E|nr:ParM/StbA family protein [Leptolyngbya sp. NIES-2104]GAQ00116.1 hypothetical protein NIES2104_66810 [Leptolyngbya sp. NIES-2104]